LKAFARRRRLANIVMRTFVGPVLLLALLAAPCAAGAQSRQTLADAARAFDESALRADDNNAKPMPVRKWMGPVRLSFANASAAFGLVEPSRQGIKTIATEAGIAVIDLANGDPSANFVVYFDENGLNGRSGYCFGSARWNAARIIIRGELRLNPTRIRDFDRCAIHEPMHSFGFLSHPHAAESVLSYVFKGQRTLTELDRYLIRTLYDPQLTPGMPAPAASQAACRILARWLKSPAADADAVCSNRTGPVAAAN
jgi:hypothetical protein